MDRRIFWAIIISMMRNLFLASLSESYGTKSIGRPKCVLSVMFAVITEVHQYIHPSFHT
jgi:hypothetical protein